MSRLVLKLLLWFFLLLLAGVLAHFMVRYPGYVMVAWGQWMLEITLWTAVGAAVVVVLAIWLALRLLRGVNPVRLARHYRGRRDTRQARLQTERAVKAWLKGDEDTTLEALDKVAKTGGSERLPRILTLIPAQDSADWPERQAALAQADPELAVVGQALRANQLLRQGDADAFVELFEQEPELAEVKALRVEYWRALMARGQAGKALTQIARASGLNPADRERWQQQGGLALIHQAERESPEQLAGLKSLPRKMRQHPDIVAAEVRCLASHDKLDEAFRLLKKHLEKDAHDSLVLLLSELPFETAPALKLAEQLESRQSPPSPALSLALGELCEREALWGKAQDYLSEAWHQGATRRAGLALAAHFEQRQMTDRALAIYRELATHTSGDSSLG